MTPAARTLAENGVDPHLEILDDAPLTLAALLEETRDMVEWSWTPAGGGVGAPPAAARVFYAHDPRYWHLSDWRVSSALSGPSILLIRR